MAKKQRKVVGSVIKSKESGRPDYIKINNDVTLTKGQTLSLMSKERQLQDLESAVSAGKLSGEVADGIKERINKIPDFVRFEIVLLQDL